MSEHLIEVKDLKKYYNKGYYNHYYKSGYYGKSNDE